MVPKYTNRYALPEKMAVHRYWSNRQPAAFRPLKQSLSITECRRYRGITVSPLACQNLGCKSLEAVRAQT